MAPFPWNEPDAIQITDNKSMVVHLYISSLSSLTSIGALRLCGCDRVYHLLSSGSEMDHRHTAAHILH